MGFRGRFSKLFLPVKLTAVVECRFDVKGIQNQSTLKPQEARARQNSVLGLGIASDLGHAFAKRLPLLPGPWWPQQPFLLADTDLPARESIRKGETWGVSESGKA